MDIVEIARNSQLMQIGQKTIYKSLNAYTQPMQDVQSVKAYNARNGKALVISSSGNSRYVNKIRVPTSINNNTMKNVLSIGGIAFV